MNILETIAYNFHFKYAQTLGFYTLLSAKGKKSKRKFRLLTILLDVHPILWQKYNESLTLGNE
jgi:hypothetical protein